MIYIGIDPGKTGAIAILDRCPVLGDTARVIDVHTDNWPQPVLDTWLHSREPAEDLLCVIGELPDGRPGRGVSKFTFNAGRLLGYWDGRARVVHTVAASVWTSAMGVGRDKGESLELARKLFPALAPLLARKKDHNRAQALLIAEYGRRCQL